MSRAARMCLVMLTLSPLLPFSAYPQQNVPGRALFVGERRLANDGTACIACHSVAGLGILGGGSVGPDLTQAFTKYGGEQGLTGVLAAVPFPTMAPLYRNHPITVQEQADLAGFLKASAAAAPTEGLYPLVMFVAAGLAALLVVLYAVWSNRLKPVRDSLQPR